MQKDLPPYIESTLTVAEKLQSLQPRPSTTPFTEHPTRLQVEAGPDFYSEWNPFTNRCHRIVRVHPTEGEKV